MDKKTLRNDIILIGSLLLVAVISLILVLSIRSTKDNRYANVYVQNEPSFAIDLSKKEEKDYPVYAFNSEKVLLTIHTNDKGEVAVTRSTCPHQDCVNMGYVSVTNKPIICAYNQVYIVIENKPCGEIR